MKLNAQNPIADKISEDGYEVRIFDSASGSEQVIVGCEVKANAAATACRGAYEIFEMPSSASFSILTFMILFFRGQPDLHDGLVIVTVKPRVVVLYTVQLSLIQILPCITPASDLVKRFTNRLRGGILMNPNMIKRHKMILAHSTSCKRK